jgi:hypothetical protein
LLLLQDLPAVLLLPCPEVPFLPLLCHCFPAVVLLPCPADAWPGCKDPPLLLLLLLLLFHFSLLPVLFNVCDGLLPADAAGLPVLLLFQAVALAALSPGTAAAAADGGAACPDGFSPVSMSWGCCSADVMQLHSAQHSSSASHWLRHPAPARWLPIPIRTGQRSAILQANHKRLARTAQACRRVHVLLAGS